jgi:hypothetical protein
MGYNSYIGPIAVGCTGGDHGSTGLCIPTRRTGSDAPWLGSLAGTVPRGAVRRVGRTRRRRERDSARCTGRPCATRRAARLDHRDLPGARARDPRRRETPGRWPTPGRRRTPEWWPTFGRRRNGQWRRPGWRRARQRCRDGRRWPASDRCFGANLGADGRGRAGHGRCGPDAARARTRACRRSAWRRPHSSSRSSRQVTWEDAVDGIVAGPSPAL